MAKKTPLQQVNELHGGKEKLVDKLLGMLDRAEESKDDFRKRLLAVPNTKLLRLLEVTEKVKQQFGDKDKLVDALLVLKNRAKDADYRERLRKYPPAKLLDMYRSSQNKAKAA